jgi:hypothetical protein
MKNVYEVYKNLYIKTGIIIIIIIIIIDKGGRQIRVLRFFTVHSAASP